MLKRQLFLQLRLQCLIIFVYFLLTIFQYKAVCNMKHIELLGSLCSLITKLCMQILFCELINEFSWIVKAFFKKFLCFSQF